LGLAGQNAQLPQRYVRHFRLEQAGAVRVMEIVPGGPADRAGIRAGDLIIRFAGSLIGSIDNLHRSLDLERIGRECPVSVLRYDREITLSVRPVELLDEV